MHAKIGMATCDKVNTETSSTHMEQVQSAKVTTPGEPP